MYPHNRIPYSNLLFPNVANTLIIRELFGPCIWIFSLLNPAFNFLGAK